MSECTNFDSNIQNCNCTYKACPRKGKCCECIQYHQKRGELPACYFSKEAEKTYNRSIEYFIRLNS